MLTLHVFHSCLSLSEKPTNPSGNLLRGVGQNAVQWLFKKQPNSLIRTECVPWRWPEVPSVSLGLARAQGTVGSHGGHWAGAGLGSLDGSSFFQTATAHAGRQTQNGLSVPLGYCVMARKLRFHFLLDVFKGNTLLWDLKGLLDVVGLLGAGDPHCLQASPSPGDARAIIPRLTHELSRASLKHSMLFLNLSSWSGVKVFSRSVLHPPMFLGAGGMLPAEQRSTEQSRQTGSAGSPAGQSRRGWPCFLPGRVSFPAACWIIVGSGRDRRC